LAQKQFDCFPAPKRDYIPARRKQPTRGHFQNPDQPAKGHLLRYTQSAGHWELFCSHGRMHHLPVAGSHRPNLPEIIRRLSSKNRWLDKRWPFDQGKTVPNRDDARPAAAHKKWFLNSGYPIVVPKAAKQQLTIVVAE